jgi:hypothetical protein
MRFGSDLSTGALMRLIVLIALELVLFQGVWSIVWVPRITMMVVALNLGLYLVLIRPRHLNTAAVGMMVAALVAVLVATAYAAVRFQVHWPPVIPWGRRWFFESVSVGVFGRRLLDFLSSLLSVPPDTTSEFELMILKLGRWVPLIESVLLDLIGLTVILAGGRFGGRWHRRRQRGGANERAPSYEGRALAALDSREDLRTSPSPEAPAGQPADGGPQDVSPIASRTHAQASHLPIGRSLA